MNRSELLEDSDPGTATSAQLGKYAWTPTHLVSRSTFGFATPVAAGGLTRNQVFGSVAITTDGTINHGGTFSLTPAGGLGHFLGLPPQGFELMCRLNMVNTATNQLIWFGLWNTASLGPDAAWANDARGVGVVYRQAGSAGNWYTIARNGTTSGNETIVDTGIAGNAGSWDTFGIRFTASGIFGTYQGRDVGTELTTDLPATTDVLFPVIGIYNYNSGVVKTLKIDTFGIAGYIHRW